MKPARAPMASMTWRGMFGNGSTTGMTLTITSAAHRRTRRDRFRANPKYCVVARGAAIDSICDPHSGTSTGRHTGTRTTGSGARKLHSPWSLALRPRGLRSPAPWWEWAIRVRNKRGREAVCDERNQRSSDGSGAVLMMRVGPSMSACRCRFQTAASGVDQESSS